MNNFFLKKKKMKHIFRINDSKITEDGIKAEINKLNKLNKAFIEENLNMLKKLVNLG